MFQYRARPCRISRSVLVTLYRDEFFLYHVVGSDGLAMAFPEKNIYPQPRWETHRVDRSESSQTRGGIIPLLHASASIHAIDFNDSIVMIAEIHNLPSAVLASPGALLRLARPAVHVAEGQRRSWRGRRRWGPRGSPPLPHWSWRPSSQLSRPLTPLQERSARGCTGASGSTPGLTIACLCLEEFDRSNRAWDEQQKNTCAPIDIVQRHALRSVKNSPTTTKIYVATIFVFPL